MAKTFRPYQPDQLLLLPPSLKDWLPPGHLVYFVSDLVETLDLTVIYDSYSEERGFPPYHPLLMTKLLLYGYCLGVRSSRRLERATKEDVAFRVLCAGNEPDFRTIAAFRVRHLEALDDLFLQVLRLCQEAGLVKLGHVAIDGTKVRANASKHKAMSYGRMEQEEERLRALIRQILDEAARVDEEEDALYGPDKRGDELPEELAHPQTRLKKIQEAKAALEAEAREKATRGEAETDEVPPKAQRNFTDPDSRIMRSSDKAFVQAYNAQAAVDAEHQVIVAAEVVQEANDKAQLVPMVEAVADNLGETPELVSADAGYWSEAAVEQVEDYWIEALVAPKKIRHREWLETPIEEDPPPEGLPVRDRMAWILRTERGREEYGKRMITAEPVFGQMKGAMGFREFLLRGHRKVQGEWKLASAAHNVLKLFRAGVDPRALAGLRLGSEAG
jgi:transposase